jgi:hypothetical protein
MQHGFYWELFINFLQNINFLIKEQILNWFSSVSPQTWEGKHPKQNPQNNL